MMSEATAVEMLQVSFTRGRRKARCPNLELHPCAKPGLFGAPG